MGAVEVSGVAATVAISRVAATVAVAVEVDLVVAVEDARSSRWRIQMRGYFSSITNDWNEAYSLFQCSYLSQKHDLDWEK